MARAENDYSHIKGWAIDADPNNDPTYPMKRHNNGEHEGLSWERPPLQPLSVEVLHSNERPNVTAVFGTSKPPSGLNGMIRRFAFRYSEDRYLHWLPLMLADRVDSLEAILSDLAHGHLTNIAAEKGWAAEWRYNRASFVQRKVVQALLALILLRLLRRKS